MELAPAPVIIAEGGRSANHGPPLRPGSRQLSHPHRQIRHQEHAVTPSHVTPTRPSLVRLIRRRQALGRHFEDDNPGFGAYDQGPRRVPRCSKHAASDLRGHNLRPGDGIRDPGKRLDGDRASFADNKTDNKTEMLVAYPRIRTVGHCRDGY
jgi:hypothetical protein